MFRVHQMIYDDRKRDGVFNAAFAQWLFHRGLRAWNPLLLCRVMKAKSFVLPILEQGNLQVPTTMIARESECLGSFRLSDRKQDEISVRFRGLCAVFCCRNMAHER